MAWDSIENLAWMQPDRNWGSSAAAAANIFMSNRRLAQDQQQFMMELPAKMAESDARVANSMLDSQATIAKLNDGLQLKSAMLQFANAKTQDEKASISPVFTTPAAQSAWTKFRADNFVSQNVNDGFSQLGNLGVKAAQLPDGWASPEIQREFNQIVAKYPEVTTNPRFSLFENNFDAAKRAKDADERLKISQGNLDVRKRAVDLQEKKAQAGPKNKDLERIESKRTELAGAMARIKSLREQLVKSGDDLNAQSTIQNQIVSAEARVPELEAEIVELQRRVNTGSSETTSAAPANPPSAPSRKAMIEGGSRVRTFNPKTGQFE